MTLEEAIIDCREVAEIHEQKMKQCDSASGFTRSHNASIRTTDAKRHEVKAKEYYQIAEWLKDYKRLKEQEPCEDAVSRKAVHDMLENLPITVEDKWFNWLQKACMRLADLPSVTPQPKTGHWIEGRSDNPNIHNILCSRCFEGYPSKGHANSQHTKEKFKWCPNCGAYMIGESEK